MFISLCLVLAAVGILYQPAIAQEYSTNSGNYHIRYCGRGPGSKAAQLQTLLPQFWSNLQLAVTDVKRGTASKAYRAYFKSQGNAAYVESIFQKMADGAPVQISVSGAPSKSLRPLWPSILCLDPGIPGVETLQAVCDGTATAAIVPHREIVLLCPPFWETLKKVPLRSDCPKVRRNKFVPDDYRVMYNQYGTFVHEFTHAYTRNWDTKEFYNPMDAVKLSAEASLRNPNNYALYAVSVAAGCTKYVNPNLLRDEERMLQESSEGNTTDIAGVPSAIAAGEAPESIDSPPGPAVPTNPPAANWGNGVLLTSLENLIPPINSGAPVAAVPSEPTTK